MNKLEFQTKYNIREKCHFDYNRLPDLKEVKFGALRFPKKGHFILHQNNVITYSSRASKPVLFLQNNNERKFIPFSFKTKWIENQFPNSWFSKMDLDELEEIFFKEKDKYLKENYGSFRFERLLSINSINKYSVSFKGKEEYIKYNFQEKSNRIYEFDIDLNIDIAFGFDLENNKTILITYCERDELNKVHIGSKESLIEMGALRIEWITKNKWINFKEKKIK